MGAASRQSLGDSLPEGCSSSWRITGHREAIAFVLARGMNPPSNHYDDLENIYVGERL